MNNVVQTIHSLSDLLSLKPASDSQITEAESQLNTKFAKEYKEYLAAYGAIMADGIELTGIAKSEYRNVVAQTRNEWKLNAKIPHTMYVIENTHIDGIIIWQDSDGIIYKSAPDTNPTKIAESLTEYISKFAN